MERTPTSSRPLTPDSPIRNLLINRDSSLQLDDDLTNSLLALRSFSMRSGETTPLPLSCCCGNEDCVHLREWRDAIEKLEKQLVLSAEIGQALLHRHEAYARNQENILAQAERKAASSRDKIEALTSSNTQLLSKLSTLVKENTAMEKRLAQTSLNLEVADASNRTLLHELQETRDSVTRLSSLSMKAVGWEARVQSLTEERDDLREEKRAESSRARAAEGRANALADKCAKLQADLYNLREERETRRLSKADLSEEIIRDARLRLENLHATLSSTATPSEPDAEFMKVLEGLVGENEALKHDNAELQNLLTDSREDIRALREEVEERRAPAPPTPGTMDESRYFPFMDTRAPIGGRHKVRESWASSMSAPAPLSPPRSEGFLSPRMSNPRRRTPSYSISHANRKSVIHPRRSPSEQGDDKPEQSTEDEKVPLSPALSYGSRRTSISHHSHAASNFSIEHETNPDGQDAEPLKGRKRQLLLLTRSRGTQTDPVVILPSSPLPPSNPPSFLEDPKSGNQSDTSSFHEGRVSQMALLLEKISLLITRMAQADVRTLTARLKRQHLSGADVGHLSRSTISSILNEVSTLRTHFRQVLDDERSVVLASRKEFRTLLKMVNEVFQEWGSLRASVNEVVLNPAVANRLREEALAAEDSSKMAKPAGGIGGWIAPLQKLWGNATPETPDPKNSPPVQPVGALGRSGTVKRGLQPKVAPKLAPAVSASTTTVNVEFTNAGIRRAISTTPDPPPLRARGNSSGPSPLGLGNGGQLPTQRPQLAGIFAGASNSGSTVKVATTGDSLAMPPPPVPATMNTGARTTGRQGTMRFNQRSPIGDPSRRLSRAVDAMVDQHRSSAIDDDDEEEDEFQNNLLQRTLRPRGLSDSSIASHVIAPNTGPVNRLLTSQGLKLSSPTVTLPTTGEDVRGGITTGGWLDKDAVWQGIRTGMGRFRFATPYGAVEAPSKVDVGTGSTPSGTPTATTSTLPRPPTSIPGSPARATPRRINTRLKDEGSVSPRARISADGGGRGASPRTPSMLPPLTAWASPTTSMQNDGETKAENAVGRTFGRARGL